MPHSHRTLPRRPGTSAPVVPDRIHGGPDHLARSFSLERWFRLVIQSLLAGLLVSGGVAVSWQTDAPVVTEDAPLFTPGPGSVGAAANLESPARRVRDIGDSVRRGWNDGGLLDLESVGPPARGVAGAEPSAAALAGTEFEELDAVKPPPSGSVAGGGAARVGGVPSGAPADKGAATPDRWAARDNAPTAPIPAAPRSPPAASSGGGDGGCGWLGLGCASRGMWMAIGGLSAAGLVLTALIVRELYFVR